MTYILVRKAGIEPARGCPQRILSLLRLPVPPYPHKTDICHIQYSFFFKSKDFFLFYYIFYHLPQKQKRFFSFNLLFFLI